MSYIIQHVTVEGLWGVKSFDTDFHTDINILIGQNGSNKTTFLNLIEGCLNVDLRPLAQVPFDKIHFHLINDKDETKEILVEKSYDENWVVIKYLIEEESVEIRTLEEYDDRPYRYSSIMRESIMRAKHILKGMVKMSWLTVDRNPEIYDDHHSSRNVVDKKLDVLMQELAMYRLKIMEGTNKLTRELNSNVLSLLLFDGDTDDFDFDDINRFSSLDPREIKASLYRVFNQMGNMKQMSDRIQAHIARLTSVIEKAKTGASLVLQDAAALVLINRTMTMIDLSQKYKTEVDKFMAPIDIYQKTLQKFIKDKEFNFSEENGLLEVSWSYLKDGKLTISDLKHQNLSSGEKQLLILLTQTLLQEKQPYVFIADEPELSLHIEWQKDIIGAINTINPNAQVIVATHSPEIAGQWSDNIISMESITRYDGR